MSYLPPFPNAFLAPPLPSPTGSQHHHHQLPPPALPSLMHQHPLPPVGLSSFDNSASIAGSYAGHPSVSQSAGVSSSAPMASRALPSWSPVDAYSETFGSANGNRRGGPYMSSAEDEYDDPRIDLRPKDERESDEEEEEEGQEDGEEDTGPSSSSTSRRPPRSNINDPTKSYTCDFPGCDKSFNRRDYLERHALNHSSTPAHTCELCGKGFARIDVYKKHQKKYCPHRPSDPEEPERYRRRKSTTTRPPIISAPPSGKPLDLPRIAPDTSPNALTAGDIDDLLGWLFNAGPDSWLNQQAPNRPYRHQEPDDPEYLPPPLPATLGLPPPVFEERELVTERTRQEMLDLLDEPLQQEVRDIFTVKSIKLYCELYWIHHSPLYPILHRPSLAHRAPSPDLILVMVLYGTAYTHDQHLLSLATKVHKRLRHRILEMIEEQPRLPTATLQVLLLLDYFGRMYCSAREHDISQIFHSPCMALARSSGILLRRGPQPPTMPKDLYGAWLEWAAQEERNRLAWFAFLSDTGNAALFRHYLLVHCFSMQCELPCSANLWEAPDPAAWASTIASRPHPLSLRSALRDLLGKGSVHTSEDFGLWIILHGLLSVSWALLFRDLGALSMINETKIHSWKNSLKRGFLRWKSHVTRVMQERSANGLDRLDMLIYAAGMPLCHLGIILGMSDTEEIRIFAGATTIAARPVSPGEWKSAATYCNAWAKSEDGGQACWAALQLLDHILRGSVVEEAPLIAQWCLYLAVLTVWTYVSILDGHHDLMAEYVILGSDAPRIEPSLARKAAIAYVSRMLSVTQPSELAFAQGKNQCAGIVAYAIHVASQFDRGLLTEPREVLMGLLVEHAPRATASS